MLKKIKYLPLLLLLVSCNGTEKLLHKTAKEQGKICYEVYDNPELEGKYCLRYVGK